MQMNVTIEHSEQKEIVKKSLFWRDEILVQRAGCLVTVKISFTDAERVVLDKYNLWNCLRRWNKQCGFSVLYEY